MTPDEAIEVSDDYCRHPINIPTLHQIYAIKLGIEALKRHRDNRKRDYPKVYSFLPGETK